MLEKSWIRRLQHRPLWQVQRFGIKWCLDFAPKKVREKSRECHNHKPQPFPDPKRKRKPTNLNKHKRNKCTKSTKFSSLFPKRGNRNTKRTEKHKNKMTHGKTYNKSPRRINHKATKSKTNTGTTVLERSVDQATIILQNRITKTEGLQQEFFSPSELSHMIKEKEAVYWWPTVLHLICRQLQ